MKRKERIEGAKYERNYVYNFHFHLIWVTKYRRAVFITESLVSDMDKILRDLAQKADIEIEEMRVMPDHIHMLVNFKPKHAASSIVKYLKGHSAKLFFQQHPEIKRDRFWGGHLWSHSYYMSTLGNMSKDIVERYIQNQCTK